MKRDPINTMVNFLSLEQQARGSSVGFSCLYHLVSVAGSFGESDLPVSKGKISALKIVGDHYHDYPDINVVFRLLFSRARLLESKAFLRSLIDKSQHSDFRSNAMFELARYLALEANLPSELESRLILIDSFVVRCETHFPEQTISSGIMTPGLLRGHAVSERSLVPSCGSIRKNQEPR